MGNLHVAVFFLCDRLVNLQPFFVHSQLHGVEAAPWDLVMQTRKGNVAGATSGASSGPPTSPPLLCCCCRAAVVVLRSLCVSTLLEVGNVHVAFFYYVTDLTTFLTIRSVGFGNADEKGQRCWCYERCFFWSADVAAAAVLLLLRCCSCATLIMYVCLCFVLFPSCAVSPWSWELRIHPPTKNYSSTAVCPHR